VLGSKKAQGLAKKFGLKGRVDLYQAFVIGMTSVLKPGGIIGLLTSNRFLTIKSGASLRHMFASHFDIKAISDLGDTKLFTAAVLPVILVARKCKSPAASIGAFHRIYEHRIPSGHSVAKCDSLLAALREGAIAPFPEKTGRIRRFSRP